MRILVLSGSPKEEKRDTLHVTLASLEGAVTVSDAIVAAAPSGVVLRCFKQADLSAYGSGISVRKG